MDKIGGFVNKLSGGSSSSTNAAQPAAGGQPQQAGAAGGKDYGDKAMDFIQKKTGHTLSRDTNEKITDGMRTQYEKSTGSKVNPKFSN